MPSTLHREPNNPQARRGLLQTENQALLPPLSTLEVAEVQRTGVEWWSVVINFGHHQRKNLLS